MPDPYREKTFKLADGTKRTHREKPSKIQSKVKFEGESEWGRHWYNDDYYGILKFFDEGSPLGGGPYAVLSISSVTEEARHDFRDFQQLKNQLVGEEWSSLELYPSESKLKDPSNRFYLWCFPPGVVSWGLPGGRHVLDLEQADMPQRPFPR